jgi:hypothetical protein
MKKSILLLAVVMISVAGVFAQDPQTESASAAANIISPMTITKNVDLNFGNIAAGAAAGTVVMSTTGVRTPTNVILPSVTGTVTAAQFTVTGLAGSNYVITLPGTVNLTSGSNSMTLDNFTEDATNVLTGGTETFGVGATLNIEANQAVGLYTGTFDVTVDYQ